MAVIVQRPPADKPGPDIVDQLLTTVESQLERGRQEINENESDRTMETGIRPELDYVAPGTFVEIKDKHIDRRGEVTSFSLHYSLGDTATQIDVELQ